MPARRRAAARGRGGGNGPLQIVVAAACWGTTGVAGRLAGGAGAGPLTVASARTVVAAVVLGALALVLRRRGGARRGLRGARHRLQLRIRANGSTPPASRAS